MRHKSRYSLRGLIEEALDHARMQHCNFNEPDNGTEALPKDENDVTDFILHRTKRWREAWLIVPLETALAKIEARDRKKKNGGQAVQNGDQVHGGSRGLR